MDFEIEGRLEMLDVMTAPGLAISAIFKEEKPLNYVLSAAVAGGNAWTVLISCPEGNDPSEPEKGHFYTMAYPNNCGEDADPTYDSFRESLILPSLNAGLRFRLHQSLPITFDTGLEARYQIKHQFFDPYEPQDVTNIGEDYSTWVFLFRGGINVLFHKSQDDFLGFYGGVDVTGGYRLGDSFYYSDHSTGSMAVYMGVVFR